MSKKKIAIIEDHVIVSDGLQTLLSGDKYEIVGVAANQSDCNMLIKEKLPDIVLMDIRLGDDSGIYLTKQIKRENPQMKIIVLSANTDEYTIVESIKAGADGFLSKGCAQKELINAIDEVGKGFNYFGADVKQTVMDNFINRVKYPEQVNNKHLTDRELEITRLFAESYTFKEIGNKLNISPKTVEAHKKKILTKLNLKTTIDLVKFAIKHKIIDI